jgi:hypothetical protein
MVMAIGFAGKELKRIEELEAEVANLTAGLEKLGQEWDADIKRLKAEHEVEKLNLRSQSIDVENTLNKLHKEDKLRIEGQHDQEIAAKDHALTLLEGRLEQSEKFAQRYWTLANGWRWHRVNHVEIDGVEYQVYEARADNPLARFRVPVKVGDEFP